MGAATLPNTLTVTIVNGSMLDAKQHHSQGQSSNAYCVLSMFHT